MKLRRTDLHLSGWELYEDAETALLYLDITKDKTETIFSSHGTVLNKDGLTKGEIIATFNKPDLSLKNVILYPVYGERHGEGTLNIEKECEKCMDALNETIHDLWSGMIIMVNNEKKHSWNDEHELFPEFLDGTFTREEFSQEREKEWVDFCFDSYEYDGFRDAYHSPYGNDREGMDYDVLGRVSDDAGEEYNADLECLPLWVIRFSDGFTTTAGPEEICLTETPEYMEKYKNIFSFVR